MGEGGEEGKLRGAHANKACLLGGRKTRASLSTGRERRNFTGARVNKACVSGRMS